MKLRSASHSCKDCKRPVFGPTARCSACQAIRRANRRTDRAAFPKPKRIRESQRNPEHLAWIRTLPCTVRGCIKGEAIHAHHVRTGTGGGTGIKPADRWSVPLCAHHHQQGHQIGWKSSDYGDLKAEAERLYLLSPHRKVHPEAD